ncbi:MAG: toxin-antitoxin system HicB family antitoxin, partial [Actinomycetota bacterium]
MAVAGHERLDEYLGLPYPLALLPGSGDDAGGWRAVVEDLPGCEARGRTAEEAAARVRDAMAAWIADALANGRDVPRPRDTPTHSGRLLVRMPPTLHSELARLADRERVSLNTLIVGVLGGAVAWRRPAGDIRDDAAPLPDPGAGAAPPRRDRSRL